MMGGDLGHYLRERVSLCRGTSASRLNLSALQYLNSLRDTTVMFSLLFSNQEKNEYFNSLTSCLCYLLTVKIFAVLLLHSGQKINTKLILTVPYAAEGNSFPLWLLKGREREWDFTQACRWWLIPWKTLWRSLHGLQDIFENTVALTTLNSFWLKIVLDRALCC